MNAREAMQALLDGKVVTGHKIKLMLNKDGYLLSKEIEGWGLSHNGLNDMTGVVEEYPLTFKEALCAMMDGKVVTSKNSYSKYRLRGTFQCWREIFKDDWAWEDTCGFDYTEQESKWKVVE